MTLVEFLLARIVEDEAVARSATPGPWLALDGGVRTEAVNDDGNPTSWPVDSTETRPDRVHIAHFDPVRVLAESEVKRRILGLHTPGEVPAGSEYMTEDCWTCGDGDYNAVKHPCKTLRLLALPYVSHPEYRSEWRP